jgi:hypothetical protein
LVSTFTPPIVAEVTLLAPAVAGLLAAPAEAVGVALAGAELDDELLELQATRAVAATAPTGSASRILRCPRAFIGAYDLLITSPLLSDRPESQAT